MRRRASASIALGFLAFAFSFSAAPAAQSPGDYRPGAANIPATTQPIGHDKELFHFVVVGDRTGGHRPGVFSNAIRQVDNLRPDFVLGIGDLIEGKTEDLAQLNREWDEIDGALSSLNTRFFHVPGNHDLANNVQREVWHQRLGADYYSFAYKDVLFLVLNTEDPPQPEIDRLHLFQEYGPEAMQQTVAALQGDPEEAKQLLASNPKLVELATKLRNSENVAISTDQLQMVKDALRRHPNPRWTFVLMHRPAWKVQSPAFQQIEQMLADRPHTIFAGHFHKYSHERRGNADYIQLGTTGGMPGGSTDDPSVVDHIMWVTMDKGAPHITNIKLDGLFPKQGPAADAITTTNQTEAENK